MTAPTLQSAKSDLVALFSPDGHTPDPSLTRTVRVYNGEPRDMLKAVVVSVATAGLSAYEFVFRVRVYAPADTDPATAQDALDVTVWEVEQLLNTSPRYARSDWEWEWVEPLAAVVASTELTRGREDF